MLVASALGVRRYDERRVGVPEVVLVGRCAQMGRERCTCRMCCSVLREQVMSHRGCGGRDRASARVCIVSACTVIASRENFGFLGRRLAVQTVYKQPLFANTHWVPA